MPHLLDRLQLAYKETLKLCRPGNHYHTISKSMAGQKTNLYNEWFKEVGSIPVLFSSVRMFYKRQDIAGLPPRLSSLKR